MIGNRHDLIVQLGGVTGFTQMFGRHRFEHIANTGTVITDSGLEHGAGGGARPCNMKVGEAHTSRRQPVNVWRGNLSAKGTNIAKAPIIGDEDDDIGSPFHWSPGAKRQGRKRS